ncbi:hypothetical protein C7N43_32025 [Sphingobacteriales bacterium UPWRP_1]|nr:hypothetical protein BVG80_01375 [Sphingobacteriales bacterium TSM_CSM]PSJ72861.1 hypothetical protein C7N43_32025 [Sphingobacteriales bacterium UPWRP_1]
MVVAIINLPWQDIMPAGFYHQYSKGCQRFTGFVCAFIHWLFNRKERNGFRNARKVIFRIF